MYINGLKAVIVDNICMPVAYGLQRFNWMNTDFWNELLRFHIHRIVNLSNPGMCSILRKRFNDGTDGEQETITVRH